MGYRVMYKDEGTIYSGYWEPCSDHIRRFSPTGINKFDTLSLALDYMLYRLARPSAEFPKIYKIVEVED